MGDAIADLETNVDVADLYLHVGNHSRQQPLLEALAWPMKSREEREDVRVTLVLCQRRAYSPLSPE